MKIKIYGLYKSKDNMALRVTNQHFVNYRDILFIILTNINTVI